MSLCFLSHCFLSARRGPRAPEFCFVFFPPHFGLAVGLFFSFFPLFAARGGQDVRSELKDEGASRACKLKMALVCLFICLFHFLPCFFDFCFNLYAFSLLSIFALLQ